MDSMLEEMKAGLEEMVAYEAKMEAMIKINQEQLRAEIKAGHERLEALMDVSLEKIKACLGKTKTRNQGKPKLRLTWKK
jgi:ribosome-associated translation inhibitor RaiA